MVFKAIGGRWGSNLRNILSALNCHIYSIHSNSDYSCCVEQFPLTCGDTLPPALCVSLSLPRDNPFCPVSETELMNEKKSATHITTSESMFSLRIYFQDILSSALINYTLVVIIRLILVLIANISIICVLSDTLSN